MNWYKRQLKIAIPIGVGRGWSAEEIEKIKNLILQGKSFGFIAKMFGVSPTTIRNINDKHKWRQVRKYNPPIEWSQEDLEKMKKMLEDGYSYKKISKFFGIGDLTVKKTNEKYKLVDMVKLRDKKDKHILNLYLLPPDGKGMSAQSMQKQYGINPVSIQTVLRNSGLSNKWRGQSEAQKQKYINNPDAALEQSNKLKQRHIDRPELAVEHSKFMKEKWKEWGGMEGLLLSYSTREQAINWLKGFVQRLYDTNPQAASGINAKYMKVINNHTYPDEVQQEVSV